MLFRSKLIRRNARQRVDLRDKSKANLLQPGGSKLFSGILPRDTYQNLNRRTRNLITKLGAMQCLVRVLVRWSKAWGESRDKAGKGRLINFTLEAGEELRQGLLLLMRSDQHHFPAARKKNDGLMLWEAEGILVRPLRIGKSAAERLFGSDALPFLSNSSPLLESLYFFKHMFQEGGLLGRVHLSTISTVSNLTTGQLGISSPSLTRYVSSKRGNCSPCRQLHVL